MSRPKGSKNKPKEVVKVKEPVVDEIKNAATASLKEIFNPKPDMGPVKPPPVGELICNCGHEKKLHFGGPRGWCNKTGCNCQGFAS